VEKVPKLRKLRKLLLKVLRKLRKLRKLLLKKLALVRLRNLRKLRNLALVKLRKLLLNRTLSRRFASVSAHLSERACLIIIQGSLHFLGQWHQGLRRQLRQRSLAQGLGHCRRHLLDQCRMANGLGLDAPGELLEGRHRGVKMLNLIPVHQSPSSS